MCCCFKSRRPPSVWISIMSALVLVSGAVIAAFAIKFAIGDSAFNVKTLVADP